MTHTRDNDIHIYTKSNTHDSKILDIQLTLQNKNRARLKCTQLETETGCLWHKCFTTTFQLRSLLCGWSSNFAEFMAACRHLAGIS